jgi:hypothetical protein
VYRNFQDLTEFYEELKDLDARTAQSEIERYQRELPLEGAAAGDDSPPPSVQESSSGASGEGGADAASP